MAYTLDFASLPDDASFEKRSILIGPPTDLKTRLGSMPQTFERVESAIMFAGQCSKQSEPWRAAAFLRAALADYCSIEEMQKLDRPSEAHYKLATSANPLLHLLELLRHLNVHVKTVETAEHTINVQFKDQTSDMTIYTISNLDASDLAVLKNGKHYNKADLDRSVAWFKTRQMEWGASDLISTGVTLLAVALCSHYGL